MKAPLLWWLMLAASLGILALALFLVGAHHDVAYRLRQARRRLRLRGYLIDGPRP